VPGADGIMPGTAPQPAVGNAAPKRTRRIRRAATVIRHAALWTPDAEPPSAGCVFFEQVIVLRAILGSKDHRAPQGIAQREKDHQFHVVVSLASMSPHPANPEPECLS